MKKLIALISIILCSLALHAETNENRKENPHEIRIGIADDLFLRGFENITTNDLQLPPPKKATAKQAFKTTTTAAQVTST